MRKNKNKYNLTVLAALVASVLASLVSAEVSIPNPLRANSFLELLNRIIDFIFTLSIPVAALMLIVAGFYFITALGQPEKITTAKRMILWVLIGFLVILLAKGLIQLLMTVLDINPSS